MQITHEQFSRLIYSSWDFQQALSATTFLLQDCDFASKHSNVELRRFRCYETTAIISFARPFEAARGKSVLGMRRIGIELSDAERALKARLLALRRGVIAHSDEDLMHFRSQVLAVGDSPGGRPVLPILTFVETLHLQEVDLRELELLLHKLIRGIALAIFELAQADPDKFSIHKEPSR